MRIFISSLNFAFIELFGNIIADGLYQHDQNNRDQMRSMTCISKTVTETVTVNKAISPKPPLNGTSNGRGTDHGDNGHGKTRDNSWQSFQGNTCQRICLRLRPIACAASVNQQSTSRRPDFRLIRAKNGIAAMVGSTIAAKTP